MYVGFAGYIQSPTLEINEALPPYTDKPDLKGFSI